MSADDMAKMVSPHGFDGVGPVPEMVVDAARCIAQLRVEFLRVGEIATGDTEKLFQACAIQAEWMRELLECRDRLQAVAQAAVDTHEAWRIGLTPNVPSPDASDCECP